jgi:hypothetical protein
MYVVLPCSLTVLLAVVPSFAASTSARRLEGILSS